MATGKSRKSMGVKEEGSEMLETTESSPVKFASTKIIHVKPEDFIASLNNAVANVTAIFQLRDQLKAEADALKEELSIGKEMKLEKVKLESLQREQEQFLYEFQIKKNRLEEELKTVEEEHEEKLAKQQEEQKAKLKTEADAQALKLKLEKEEQERTMKREREDWERTKNQFGLEKAAFDERQKTLETERSALREKLIQELNRDNTHAIEILKLHHEKDLELSKGELKLEQSQRAKFEILLKESKIQIDKLSDQLTLLSKEALASASSSAVAAKLKDIVSQMAHAGQPTRVS